MELSPFRLALPQTTPFVCKLCSKRAAHEASKWLNCVPNAPLPSQSSIVYWKGVVVVVVNALVSTRLEPDRFSVRCKPSFLAQALQLNALALVWSIRMQIWRLNPLELAKGNGRCACPSFACTWGQSMIFELDERQRLHNSSLTWLNDSVDFQPAYSCLLNQLSARFRSAGWLEVAIVAGSRCNNNWLSMVWRQLECKLSAQWD